MSLRMSQWWRGVKPGIVVVFLVFAACTFTSSPSSDVNQKSVFQRYEGTYDEHTGETVVEAHFRFGGDSSASLELDGNSSIHHFWPDGTKGIAMDKVKSKVVGEETYYEGKTRGYQEKHLFEYTNNDGDHFKNHLFIPIIGLPRGGALRTLETNQTVTWVGKPVQAYEYVRIILEDRGTNNYIASGYTSKEGDTSVSLGTDWQSKVVAGATKQIRLERGFRGPIEDGPGKKQGEIWGTYFTEPVPVDIRAGHTGLSIFIP